MYEIVVGKQPTVVVRLASFGASEIASEAIWIDANWSNEARRTSRARFIAASADLSASLSMVIEQTRADNEF